MRKNIVLFITTIIITSCSIHKSNENKIIGKWYISSVARNGKNIDFLKDGNCEKEYTEFKNDGKVDIVSFTKSDNCRKNIKKATYSLKEGKIILIRKDSENLSDYVINGNTMTFKREGNITITFKRFVRYNNF